MDGNANPCGEYGEGCIRLSKVRELAAELTSVVFATWRILRAPHCQVCVPKMDVIQFTVLHWSFLAPFRYPQ